MESENFDLDFVDNVIQLPYLFEFAPLMKRSKSFGLFMSETQALIQISKDFSKAK